MYVDIDFVGRLFGYLWVDLQPLLSLRELAKKKSIRDNDKLGVEYYNSSSIRRLVSCDHNIFVISRFVRLSMFHLCGALYFLILNPPFFNAMKFQCFAYIS